MAQLGGYFGETCRDGWSEMTIIYQALEKYTK